MGGGGGGGPFDGVMVYFCEHEQRSIFSCSHARIFVKIPCRVAKAKLVS